MCVLKIVWSSPSNVLSTGWVIAPITRTTSKHRHSLILHQHDKGIPNVLLSGKYKQHAWTLHWTPFPISCHGFLFKMDNNEQLLTKPTSGLLGKKLWRRSLCGDMLLCCWPCTNDFACVCVHVCRQCHPSTTTPIGTRTAWGRWISLQHPEPGQPRLHTQGQSQRQASHCPQDHPATLTAKPPRRWWCALVLPESPIVPGGGAALHPRLQPHTRVCVRSYNMTISEWGFTTTCQCRQCREVDVQLRALLHYTVCCRPLEQLFCDNAMISDSSPLLAVCHCRERYSHILCVHGQCELVWLVTVNCYTTSFTDSSNTKWCIFLLFKVYMCVGAKTVVSMLFCHLHCYIM